MLTETQARLKRVADTCQTEADLDTLLLNLQPAIRDHMRRELAPFLRFPYTPPSDITIIKIPREPDETMK